MCYNLAMNKQRLRALSAALCVLLAMFSFANVSFHLDISVFALPISLILTACLFYLLQMRLFSKNDCKVLPASRVLLQYTPYLLLFIFVIRRAGETGTAYIVDCAAVFLWVVSSLLVLTILFFFNPKRAAKIDPGWQRVFERKSSSRKTIKHAFLEVISWVDAFFQAVCMVLLLNIFIVQLYEIPSESMVPEFLIKDRVVVFKTPSGPRFPLSDIALPYFKRYKRGDIVVFRNPHYSDDRQSEVRTFVSQIVYMLSLTSVNLNVDERGNPKADPLVKRVTGVAGEQLMMQDGVLYSRTENNLEWQAVKEDASWAAWNLNAVRRNLKEGIRDFVVSNDDYETMLECERQRNALEIDGAKTECLRLSAEFKRIYQAVFADEKSLQEARRTAFDFDAKTLFEYSLFSRNESLTKSLISASNGDEEFSAFMTDWISHIPEGFSGDLYSEANYKLNLMIKMCAGALVVRNAELLSSGIPQSQWQADELNTSLIKQAEMLNAYIFLLDRRNMPIFPPNASDGSALFIPDDCYFMMGDNRFNSLDMRHSYEERITSLTAHDAYSVTYYTNLEPQYVNKSRILGTTAWRFWPWSRRGIPGHSGM